MKQRTLLREVTIAGKGLYTGEEVNVTLKPAESDRGVVFIRTDLYDKPEIKPDVDMVSEFVRSVTIQSGYAKLRTIEHVLSALNGLGVDNVVIEIDSAELPIIDGSAKEFVNAINQAVPVEQDKDREFFELKEPVSVTHGNRSIIALPYDGFKITCTSADDRGIRTQHLSLDIDPETYMSEIAPARTFTLYEDIEELLKLGKIRGGSLDSAIIIKGDKISSKEPLRFKDEFVRHKMLDIVGDIALLRKPLKAHIIAVRSGHDLNAELTRAVKKKMSQKKGGKLSKKAKRGAMVHRDETSLNIRRILDTLPHRYPFVLVDRILAIKGDDELVGIKNVTINEPFFQGHFPGNPVMPGVLQVEAMAQASGILMLRRTTAENKLTLFMSCDKVKFRRPVEPGDQLEIHVKLNKVKESKAGQIVTSTAQCKVDGKVVSSAELMLTIIEAAQSL